MRKLNYILVLSFVLGLISSAHSATMCSVENTQEKIVQETSKEIEHALFVIQLRNSTSKRVDRSEPTKAQYPNLDNAIKNTLELVAQDKGISKAGRSL